MQVRVSRMKVAARRRPNEDSRCPSGSSARPADAKRHILQMSPGSSRMTRRSRACRRSSAASNRGEEGRIVRKTIALLVIAAVALALPVFAATRTGKVTPHTVSGQITKWDDAAGTFTLKTRYSKGMNFVWNDKTQIVGTGKVG